MRVLRSLLLCGSFVSDVSRAGQLSFTAMYTNTSSSLAVHLVDGSLLTVVQFADSCPVRRVVRMAWY